MGGILDALQVCQFSRENSLAVRAGDHTASSRQCGGKIHLVAEQPHGFQRRHAVATVRALDRRFEPVNRVESLRLAHP